MATSNINNELKEYFLILARSELDSELLDDRSTVLGVLTADDKGLCLLGKPMTSYE